MQCSNAKAMKSRKKKRKVEDVEYDATCQGALRKRRKWRKRTANSRPRTAGWKQFLKHYVFFFLAANISTYLFFLESQCMILRYVFKLCLFLAFSSFPTLTFCNIISKTHSFGRRHRRRTNTVKFSSYLCWILINCRKRKHFQHSTEFYRNQHPAVCIFLMS